MPFLKWGACDGEPTIEDATTGDRVPRTGYSDAEAAAEKAVVKETSTVVDTTCTVEKVNVAITSSA